MRRTPRGIWMMGVWMLAVARAVLAQPPTPSPQAAAPATAASPLAARRGTGDGRSGLGLQAPLAPFVAIVLEVEAYTELNRRFGTPPPPYPSLQTLPTRIGFSLFL